MLVSTTDLIRYLRLSVKVQDSEDHTVEKDSKYLEMSDSDLTLFLEVALTRDFPKVPSLDYITPDMVYPLTLLAKKELYHTLAVKEAPLFDMVADNNNQLQRGQRFDHYMKLIAQVDDEYEQYLEDGGAGGNTLTSFDVILPTRYTTRRNFEKGVSPALSLYIDNVGNNDVCISWTTFVSKFKDYKVYVSESPIFDDYKISGKISDKAKLVATIKDIHQTKLRITGLSEDKTYYILVVVSDLSGLKGYSETGVTITIPSAEA